MVDESPESSLSSWDEYQFAFHRSRKDNLQKRKKKAHKSSPRTVITRRVNYKGVLDFHTSLVGLRRSHNIKVPRHSGHRDPQYHLRQTLASADTRACSERHEGLCHLEKMFSVPRSVEPALRKEGLRRREDGCIAVYRPALGGNDGARRKCVTHKIESLVNGAIFGCGRWNDTFERTWYGAVQPKTYDMCNEEDVN
jgi:hypothetical protein